MRIYDALQPTSAKAIHHADAPVLDVAFLRDQSHFVSVGLAKKVRRRVEHRTRLARSVRLKTFSFSVVPVMV